MKQTIIIALLAIILGSITASADIVKGRVVDSETKELMNVGLLRLRC